MRLPQGLTALVPKGMATQHSQSQLAALRLLLRSGTSLFHGTFLRYSTTVQPKARHQIKPLHLLQVQNTWGSPSLPPQQKWNSQIAKSSAKILLRALAGFRELTSFIPCTASAKVKPSPHYKLLNKE